MITAIEFLSIDEMAERTPDPEAVVVSILDRSEQHERRSFEGFRASLVLDFEDASEPAWAEPADFWPDEPTEAEHARFSQGRQERVATLGDVQRILAFVRQHHESRESVRLIAHCFGGISRSAAVAHWFSVFLWVPLTLPADRDADGANLRLIRLLDKAAGRR